jgi:transposase
VARGNGSLSMFTVRATNRAILPVLWRTPDQATRTKPRSYTEDYKRRVVDLVVSSGRTSTAVAGEVGLHPTLLCRWVRQYGAGAATAAAPRPAAASFLKPVAVPTADQAAEIAQLRRECGRLRMERDILKKSISIFAGPLR